MPQIRVPTAVSAVPSIPTTSATARPSSQARPAGKTSTSAPRFLHPARTAACVRTRWARIAAAARRSTQGIIARPSISPATPHRAFTGAPAYRRGRPAMNALVCQVLVLLALAFIRKNNRLPRKALKLQFVTFASVSPCLFEA